MPLTDHVKNICKIGQGKECCRYLVAGTQGFECAKYTSVKKMLDQRVRENSIIAQGQNCAGYVPEQSIKILN